MTERKPSGGFLSFLFGVKRKATSRKSESGKRPMDRAKALYHIKDRAFAVYEGKRCAV